MIQGKTESAQINLKNRKCLISSLLTQSGFHLNRFPNCLMKQRSILLQATVNYLTWVDNRIGMGNCCQNNTCSTVQIYHTARLTDYFIYPSISSSRNTGVSSSIWYLVKGVYHIKYIYVRLGLKSLSLSQGPESYCARWYMNNVQTH